MDSINHALEWARPYLDAYGYSAVFITIMLEGVGIPTPGLTILIGATLLASMGEMRFPSLLLVALTGSATGNIAGYTIGRFVGRQLLTQYGRRAGLTEQRLERVEGFFKRHGGAVVMVARFFDVLRQLNGLVAGMVRMPWWRFFVYNALGAILWVGVFSLGVFYLSEHMEQILPVLKRFKYYVVTIGLLVLVPTIIYFFQRRPRETPREDP